jgi:hypothetical protein
VAIALPVDHHIALVIAAARERAVIDWYGNDAGLMISRMSDADIPGAEIRVRADHSNVSAEVD